MKGLRRRVEYERMKMTKKKLLVFDSQRKWHGEGPRRGDSRLVS